MAVSSLLRPFFYLALLLALPLLTSLGCSRGPKKESKRAAYERREKAFKLIDEGEKLQLADSPNLALQRLNRSVLVKESPKAYYEMGKLFEDADKLDEAATAYQEALDLAPDYSEARYAMLSIGFQPTGYTVTDEDRAIAADMARKRAERLAARAAQAAAPVDADAAARAQREQILADAAGRRMPTSAEVRAAIFDPKAAREEQLPSAESPEFPADQEIILGSYPYHYRKATRLRDQSQYEKAAEEYDRAMQADPAQIEARLDLGDMMLMTGRSERARYHFERAAEDFPESPRPFLKLGNYYSELASYEQARSMYRKALEKDPNYAEAYNNLAVLSMQERDFNTARALLDQLIEMSPDYANAYLNRGIIASDMDNDKEAAIRYYNRYLELEGSRSTQVRKWVRELENSGN